MNLMKTILLANLMVFAGLQACTGEPATEKKDSAMTDKEASKTSLEKVEKSDAEWKQQLDPEQYRILRQKGTERAYTGKYWNNHEAGLYSCAGCGLKLFYSDAKFDSGCGWPSFFIPADENVISYHDDTTHGMKRTEVTCTRCEGHLGHVFKDGPPPTGLRYCINSASITFKAGALPEGQEEEGGRMKPEG